MKIQEMIEAIYEAKAVYEDPKADDHEKFVARVILGETKTELKLFIDTI